MQNERTDSLVIPSGHSGCVEPRLGWSWQVQGPYVFDLSRESGVTPADTLTPEQILAIYGTVYFKMEPGSK